MEKLLEGLDKTSNVNPIKVQIMCSVCEVVSSAVVKHKYHIRPNYRTVRLGFLFYFYLFIYLFFFFSKLLGKLDVKYLSRIHLLKKKESANDLSNGVYAIYFFVLFVCVCVCVCVFPIFSMKAYVVGIHLNCIDKEMQFK